MVATSGLPTGNWPAPEVACPLLVLPSTPLQFTLCDQPKGAAPLSPLLRLSLLPLPLLHNTVRRIIDNPPTTSLTLNTLLAFHSTTRPLPHRHSNWRTTKAQQPHARVPWTPPLTMSHKTESHQLSPLPLLPHQEPRRGCLKRQLERI